VAAVSDQAKKELRERTAVVTSLAKRICEHGIATVPRGYYVIVIVENGDPTPEKTACAMQANIVPNPGVSAGDILRKIATSLDAGDGTLKGVFPS
jgi:hypothetical protein